MITATEQQATNEARLLIRKALRDAEDADAQAAAILAHPRLGAYGDIVSQELRLLHHRARPMIAAPPTERDLRREDRARRRHAKVVQKKAEIEQKKAVASATTVVAVAEEVARMLHPTWRRLDPAILPAEDWRGDREAMK